ncbi:signal transduction histidine kinase [Mycetocola sp. CAN_C7]|uniref:sensor histidine kinase n=1 Tax=Mycetocola sp. CAN_C7 TaxID=2787724 RepID=UPI0018CAFA43
MTSNPPRSGAIFSPIPRGPVLDKLDRAARDAAHTQPRFSVARIEKVIAQSISLIALVFGAQTLSIALGSGLVVPEPLGTVYLFSLLGLLVIVIVAGVVSARVQRVANIVFALTYLVAVALWPVVTGGAGADSRAEPWTWYLCAIACGCISQAVRPWLATTYIVITPAVYGVARVIDGDGFFTHLDIAVQDALYGSMIGLVIMVLITMFRRAARTVDEARSAAFTRYDEAVRQHALEAERIEVDALVHDTVLASLQAADRASTPEQARATVAMASDAISRLAALDAPANGPAQTITIGWLIDLLHQHAAHLEVPFDVVASGSVEHVLPFRVAEGLYLASAQAMTNSVQHAGEPCERRVDVDAGDDGVILVTIGDNGVGFDRAAVDADRLGIRISIIERVIAVGGSVDVRSSPGSGTTVSIRWAGDAEAQRDLLEAGEATS